MPDKAKLRHLPVKEMKDNLFLLHEKFKEISSQSPAGIAIKSPALSGEISFTLGDIYNLSQKVAGWLQKEKVVKGERVAIILTNCPEWISIYFGILFCGAIAVPLDPQTKPEELGNFLKDSQAKVAFISEDLASSFNKAGFAGKTVIANKIDRELALGILAPVSVSFEDIASILYTSGTTAIPKGVMLSHKNFSANFNSIKRLKLASSKDCFLSLLPFYHAYAFMATLIFPLFLGAKIVFPPSLKSQELTKCMREESVTMLVAVPELFFNLHQAIFDKIKSLPFSLRVFVNYLLALNYWLRRITKINLGKLFFAKIHSQIGEKLRFMVSGGARLEPKVAVDLFKLGFNVLEGYGLTETSPIVSFNPARKPEFGSVGKVLAGVEVKIINPDKDGIGEVAIRGENVFKGYYNQPEETGNVKRDNWFYSGDLGFLGRGNYLYLTGRSKEVIVLSSGKNIYPEEIESYYNKTKTVKELGVLEVKDDRGIVSLQAVVVPNLDYFKIAEGGNIYGKIKWEFENISYTLPTYKRISGFILTKDDLPRTRLGKLKRFAVKERYLKDISLKQETKARPQEEISAEDLKLLNSSFGKKIIEFVKNTLSLKENPGLEDHLELDLGVDSLTKVELVAGLEKLFHISIPDKLAQEIMNVRQVILRVGQLLSNREGPGFKPGAWEPSWENLLSVEPAKEIKKNINLHPSILNRLLTLAVTKILFMVFRIFFCLRVFGRNNIPSRGHFIFCVNHASYLDGLIVAAAMPFRVEINLYFIGWKQIFEHPSLKWSNKMARLVPIDSSAELMSTMQVASFLLQNKKNICIFPEGQRTIDGKIKEFKKGVGILVKELDATVIPVAIKGAFEAWPRIKRFPSLHPIKVIFGKPVTAEELLGRIPAGSTVDKYELIAQSLREEVVRLFYQNG